MTKSLFLPKCSVCKKLIICEPANHIGKLYAEVLAVNGKMVGGIIPHLELLCLHFDQDEKVVGNEEK